MIRIVKNRDHQFEMSSCRICTFVLSFDIVPVSKLFLCDMPLDPTLCYRVWPAAFTFTFLSRTESTPVDTALLSVMCARWLGQVDAAVAECWQLA